MRMQMNIREGVKKFGDKGSEAIIKELIKYRNDKLYCQRRR